MSDQTLKPREVITVTAPAPVNNEITFCPSPGEWVMKITKSGIIFNEDAYPNAKPHDFAKAVLQIMERSFSVKFTPKNFDPENNKFYYQGQFFKTEEEFWSHVNKFTLKETSEEDFNGLFDMLKKDLFANLQMRETKITNGQLRSIIEEVFLSTLEKVWSIEKENS